MSNLWLLSEERPKPKVIVEIVKIFCEDKKCSFTEEKIKIKPLLKDGRFTFTYKVEGISCREVNNIFIKIVGGEGSFVDYLVFYQDKEPIQNAAPLYAIEETKTADSESRNTGVYQRCSKFVYIDFYYPNVKKIMLYNLQVEENEKPTKTNVFGTRMLATMGVEILGKKPGENIGNSFSSIDELIENKNSIDAPPGDNIPIRITKTEDKIAISGRLYKNGGLEHDPNIGALTAISYCLRKLGWTKDIVITRHGLSQNHIGKDNKFIKISNKIDIKLDGLSVPKSKLDSEYWHYETSSEKNVTIFLHIAIENYTNGRVIYDNHAGSERGYLHDKSGQPIVVPKYQEGLRSSYKSGNKKAIVSLPDIIVLDTDRNIIVDIEGKKSSTRREGIKKLGGFDYIETNIIKSIYKPSGFIRTVVIFGSQNNSIEEKQIGFMLNDNGEMIVHEHAPEIIKEAITNLIASQ